MASSPTPEELATARELVRAAQARGVSFADIADGVLKALTKTVVATALEEELVLTWAMTSTIRPGARRQLPQRHPHQNRADRHRRRNRSQVPRDRAGSFEPQIVRKHQRRLTRVDEIVLSLYAGINHRGDRCALRRDLCGQDLARTRSPGSPTGWWRRCRWGQQAVGAGLCRDLY